MDLNVFLDSKGKVIKWDHLNYLQKLHEKEGLKFGNRLSEIHIDFQMHQVNVKVAAKTLSFFVADALEYLMLSEHPDFIDANGTVHFIRIIDRLLDLLKSINHFGKTTRNLFFFMTCKCGRKVYRFQ